MSQKQLRKSFFTGLLDLMLEMVYVDILYSKNAEKHN